MSPCDVCAVGKNKQQSHPRQLSTLPIDPSNWCTPICSCPYHLLRLEDSANSALTEWLNGLSFTNFALPPIASSGVDQAPNHRLIFPVYGPSLQVVRSFIAVHSTSNPLVEGSFIVVLSACFPVLPEKAGKRLWWDSNPRLLSFPKCSQFL